MMIEFLFCFLAFFSQMPLPCYRHHMLARAQLFFALSCAHQVKRWEDFSDLYDSLHLRYGDTLQVLKAQTCEQIHATRSIRPVFGGHTSYTHANTHTPKISLSLSLSHTHTHTHTRLWYIHTCIYTYICMYILYVLTRHTCLLFR